MGSCNRYAVAAIVAVAAVFMASSHSRAAGTPDTQPAESSPPIPGYDPDKLYLTIRLGAWATSLSGDVGVGPVSSSVNEGFEDLIDKTNIAAFPSFSLSKGNWVVEANGMYARLSDEERFTGPLGVKRGFDVTSNTGVVDVALGYTIVRTRTTFGNAPFTLTPGIGGRWTYVDAKVNPLNLSSVSESRGWFDPYVGLQATVGLTPKLDWRTSGTVGGFGVGSQFTWTAETMLEWHFSRNVGADLGYRVLAWDYDLDGFKWDVTFQGPWIGLSFNF